MKPWERYQGQPKSGPWEKYQATTQPEPDAVMPEQSQQTGQDNGFSFTEMASNIPSSGAKLAGGLWDAVTNPVDTAEALSKSVAGMSQNANDSGLNGGPLSLLGKALDYLGVDYRQNGEAVQQAISDRYGSVDAALNTLETDPVGAMADLSMVVAPFSPKAGAAINPVNATYNTARYTAGKAIPAGLPAKMYENVAKFSTVKDKASRAKDVQTALDNGIMPTARGADKLSGLIDGLNQQLDGLIQGSVNARGTVPTKAIFQHIKELRRRYGQMNLDGPSDVRSINRMLSEFAKELHKKGKTQLTAAELQELKVKTYKRVNYDAKVGGASTASQAASDTRKTIARGAKDGIESLVPESKAINEKLGGLYSLQDPLIKASNRIDNKNFFSINDAPQIAVGGVVGNAVGGPPGAAVGSAMGALVAVLGRDKIKAFNAIQLNRIAKDTSLMTFLKNNPNLSQAEVMAIISARHPKDETQ